MPGEYTSAFATRVEHLLKRVRYRRAVQPDEVEPLIQLRYQAYLHEGAVPFNPKGELRDKFDDLPNAYAFGLYFDGVLASALRIHVLTGPGDQSPALETFPDVLAPLLESGVRMIDPNRFVANHEIARHCPELPYITLRLAFMAAENFGAEIATATVRAEHQAFYRRVLNYKPVCPPRPYPFLTKPISIMFARFQEEKKDVLKRYPFFASSLEERRQLFAITPVQTAKEQADAI